MTDRMSLTHESDEFENGIRKRLKSRELVDWTWSEVSYLIEEVDAVRAERDELKAEVASHARYRRLVRSNLAEQSWKKNNDQLRAAAERAVVALERIAGRINKTMLADCCVNKSCLTHFEGGVLVSWCSYQSGVSRGFGESGYEAKDALADLRKALGPKEGV